MRSLGRLHKNSVVGEARVERNCKDHNAQVAKQQTNHGQSAAFELARAFADARPRTVSENDGRNAGENAQKQRKYTEYEAGSGFSIGMGCGWGRGGHLQKTNRKSGIWKCIGTVCVGTPMPVKSKIFSSRNQGTFFGAATSIRWSHLAGED